MGNNIDMNTHNEKRIDFVVRKLREAMPKNWGAISAACGVPKKTIWKIAYKETLDPRGSTIDPLFDYFENIDRAAMPKNCSITE